MENDPEKYPAIEQTEIPERPALPLPKSAGGFFAHWQFANLVKLCFLTAFLFLAGSPLWWFIKSNPDWAFEAGADALLVGRDDQLYLTWPEYGDRRPVFYDDLPGHLVNAVKAREDQRFHEHPGIDFKGLARAAVVDFREKRIVQGGSTVTMQLVERVYGYPQNTNLQKVRAKIFELIMAPRLELHSWLKHRDREEGKNAVMAAYLSRVEFGHRTVGVREAAHCYFGKDVNKLTLGESAYLAGLIRGPSVNNAYRSPENAREARDAVISNMERLDLITPAQADRVHFYVGATPLRKGRKGDGFVSAAVRREMDELVKEGAIPSDYLKSNRLKVYLGCDPELEKVARTELLKRLKQIESRKSFNGARGALQGGVVVVDNESGMILASIGGRDFDRLSYDCALQGNRAVASAGKPFIYAALMEKERLTARDEISNAGLTEAEAGKVEGLMFPRETKALEEGVHPLWKGLAYSSNRMTLRAGAMAGQLPWHRLLRETGLIGGEPLPATTASWLGTYGVRPVDLAAAYAIFPRGGFYTEPYLIRRVEIDGRTIFRQRPKSRRVLSTRTCNEITTSLREVVRVGTASSYGGKQLAGSVPVAGKTGTSDEVCDAWFVGYSSAVTAVVWIGFPEGNRTILEGETGGSLAFPVWKGIMENLPDEYDFEELPHLGNEEQSLAFRD